MPLEQAFRGCAAAWMMLQSFKQLQTKLSDEGDVDKSVMCVLGSAMAEPPHQAHIDAVAHNMQAAIARYCNPFRAKRVLQA
jgi:hypothetical protein